jgi:6-phosphogluconolactonase
LPYHMYVSNSGSEFLSHFIMDETSGALQPQPNIELGGSPGAAATDAAQGVMYVCLSGRQQLASYRIDRTSGALTEIGATEMKEGPPHIATDNTDRYLLGAYYGGCGVTVHRIEDDGTLSATALQWLDTETHAHSIQTDPSNRFAFVPHTNPTNAIYQFRFDESSGRMEPNDPPQVQPETEEGPRHFAWHPHKDLLYSVNENGNTVSAFRLDPQAGTLQAFQLIGTLPEGIDPKAPELTTAEIRITSDGRHLYASNRGHESLALFNINDDGTLSAVDHFPTEPTPRFFEIDPTEGYLYSAGQNTGRVVSYRRDADSGALEMLERYDVGKTPLWIQFVKQA